MPARTWKVGELAKETGLTIRTLHHYDEIGLLKPSLHTEAGHRLYTASDVARLQQVVSLRQIGLSLEEVRGCLDNPDFSPLRVIELHLTRLTDQMALARRLRERLEAIAARLRRAEEVSAEEFLRTIEETNMVEQYYTPEQLEYLRKRKEQFGEEHIQAVQREWPELMAKVRAEMDKGTDPTSEPVLALARRWRELINEFTGGDPGIQQSLNNLWKNEGPNLAKQHGFDHDPKLSEYIGKAIQALKQ